MFVPSLLPAIIAEFACCERGNGLLSLVSVAPNDLRDLKSTVVQNELP